MSPPFMPPLSGRGRRGVALVCWGECAPHPHPPPQERTVPNVQLRTEQMGWSLGSGPPSARLMSWWRGLHAPGTLSWRAGGWALWASAPLLGGACMRGGRGPSPCRGQLHAP